MYLQNAAANTKTSDPSNPLAYHHEQTTVWILFFIFFFLNEQIMKSF